jgi:hypothetical protein
MNALFGKTLMFGFIVSILLVGCHISGGETKDTHETPAISSVGYLSGGGNIQSTNYKTKISIGNIVKVKTQSSNYRTTLGIGVLVD